MKRGGWIQRHVPLAPGKTRQPAKDQRPRKAMPRKKKRTADEDRAKFEREFGSEARVQWIKFVLSCVGCGQVPDDEHPNDNAHTANEGKSRKGHHATIAPLCATTLRGLGCHAKYDQHLPPFDTDLAREAIKLQAIAVAAAWTRMGEVAS